MLSYKMICLKCNREYVPLKNGVYVCEMAEFGPYKIWAADMVYCPTCKHAIISGFGGCIEHFQEGFDVALKEVSIYFGYNQESVDKAIVYQKSVDNPEEQAKYWVDYMEGGKYYDNTTK